MKTGLKDLDKYINLNEAQLILFSGTYFMDMLSGDIANNIMLKQNENMNKKVLEIVHCAKEYVIKRMVINESNVAYHKWTLKDQYTDDELRQIGQKTVDLIETTKHLPTIIEQDIVEKGYKLKNLVKLVDYYANGYADRKPINTLVVLDVYPVNCNEFKRYKRGKLMRQIKDLLKDKQEERDIAKFIKNMHKISHKLSCPIIIVYGINESIDEKRSIVKEDIRYIKRINRYVDKFVIGNLQDNDVFDIDVYDGDKKIGSCNLKYNRKYRRFENGKEEIDG